MANLSRRRCQTQGTLSQGALLSYLTDGSRQKEFLSSIDSSNWTITSFDPITRQVCLRVDNGVKLVNMVIAIPTIIPPN